MQKNKVIDPTNFKKMYNLFNSTKIKELTVFDATNSTQKNPHQIIQIMDHINKTGTNILIGQQKTLGIDFIDLTNLYTYDQDSIITECCGKELNKDKKYPSHYICHITILARAMKYNKIIGFLYNTIEESKDNL